MVCELIVMLPCSGRCQASHELAVVHVRQLAQQTRCMNPTGSFVNTLRPKAKWLAKVAVANWLFARSKASFNLHRRLVRAKKTQSAIGATGIKAAHSRTNRRCRSWPNGSENSKSTSNAVGGCAKANARPNAGSPTMQFKELALPAHQYTNSTIDLNAALTAGGQLDFLNTGFRVDRDRHVPDERPDAA